MRDSFLLFSRVAISVALLVTSAGGAARADEPFGGTSPHLAGDWGGARTRLEDRGLVFDVAYTGDYIENARGGIEQGGVFLGNLDMTFTLKTWQLSRWDLGTFFAYGLVNHGGKPSTLVGDAQVTDNIEAPTAAKLFELWWQRAFFDRRLSLLGGLYDVNSEFYVVESAELFLNSSFGIGAGLGTSGRNGPSIFPNSALAFRVKAEPLDHVFVSAAVMDGDPGSGAGVQIDFDAGEGVFFIAEVARYWGRSPDAPADRDEGPTQRRHVGRAMDQSPHRLKLALGTWLYSQPQLDPAQTILAGEPVTAKGHPGLYLLADVDATGMSQVAVEGLSAFVQLGWSDGDVNPFVGYTGAGLVYTGLLPMRPADTFGVAAAIAYTGSGFDAATRQEGGSPAFGETALELTYRTWPVEWFSIQLDLQWVVHPGGRTDRPNAVVPGVRFVVDL